MHILGTTKSVQCIDEGYTYFINEINKEMKLCFPFKTLKQPHKREINWITSDIKISIRHKR